MKIESILLVEDDLPKQNQITAFLSTLRQSWSLDIARSINAAVAFLDSNRYDVILLDMSLPTFNEGGSFYSSGRQQNFGGREILSYMWEMEIESQVVIITMFKDFIEKSGIVDLAQVDHELKHDFPALYKGLVYFHHNSDSWCRDLEQILSNLNA